MRYLIFLASTFTIFSLFGQSTEVFETETAGSTSFTDDGQVFNFAGTGGDFYDVETFGGAGWNGSAPDNQFIDNSFSTTVLGDGTSFSITSSGGNEILVNSLYLFISTNALANPTTTLTITGRLLGVTQYTIVKSSGFSNVATFTPYNGFTFIDFTTEGGSDNSNTPVDEIIFSTTGNGDYVALDAFNWELSTLPVELVEFNATLVNDQVKLNWSTESELDNDGFNVMRSVDGQYWTNIGFIEGVGTTTEKQNYRLIDLGPTAGLNYYQLEQVDFDGQTSLSDVRTVYNNTNRTVRVIPNPSSGSFTVVSDTDFNGHIEIEVLDNAGVVVYSGSQNLNGNTVFIRSVGLTSGVYVVKVSGNEEIITKRVVIK